MDSTLRARPLPAAAQASTRSVWDGVYTEAQAKRGEAVYRELCLECHGQDLTGGDEATPLAGPRFTGNWEGRTVGDLFERNRLTMPPGDPGTLTSQQNADVLAYILKYNKFPVGDTELARQTETLKQIQIKFQAPSP